MNGLPCNSVDSKTLFVAVSSASGNFDAIAATTGKKIRVTSFQLCTTTTAVAITFRSSTTTNLTGAMTVTAGTPWGPAHSPSGHFETVVSEKLNILQSGTSQISGWICYQLVDSAD